MSGPVPPSFRGDEEEPNAYLAECCALCFGALASMEEFPGQATTFVSDCSGALGCAAGAMSTGRSKAQGIMRGMHQLRHSSSNGPLQYLHTHSDVAEFANEIADQASKKAARGLILGSIPLADVEM